MVKDKCRFCIKIMMFVLPLVFIAWIIPVQARGAKIDTIVEEEEIKNTIHSYFEIRYHMFNTLKLEDFGNLIAKSPEGDILTLVEGDYTSLG